MMESLTAREPINNHNAAQKIKKGLWFSSAYSANSAVETLDSAVPTGDQST
jgi:hypothetical protein